MPEDVKEERGDTLKHDLQSWNVNRPLSSHLQLSEKAIGASQGDGGGARPISTSDNFLIRCNLAIYGLGLGDAEGFDLPVTSKLRTWALGTKQSFG